MKRRTWAVVAGLLGLVLGCGGGSGGGNDSGGIGDPSARVAEVEYVDGKPALFVQDGNGANRQRIHFTGATDSIPGNGADLVVADDEILALGPLRWSPDARRLAVVVTLAFEQSEIVVVNADGSNATVASVNTQLVLGRPDWSPDGTRLVYGMSTLPVAGGVDAFQTELATSTVTRLTEGANVGGPGGELRYASDGQSVLWSKASAGGDDPLADPKSSVKRLALGTGVVTDVATSVQGEVQGLFRDGTRALVARNESLDAGGRTVRALVSVPLDGRGSEIELANGVLQYAVVMEGDARALTVIDVSTDPSTPKVAYVTLPVTGEAGQLLGALGNQTVAADVYRR